MRCGFFLLRTSSSSAALALALSLSRRPANVIGVFVLCLGSRLSPPPPPPSSFPLPSPLAKETPPSSSTCLSARTLRLIAPALFRSSVACLPSLLTLHRFFLFFLYVQSPAARTSWNNELLLSILRLRSAIPHQVPKLDSHAPLVFKYVGRRVSLSGTNPSTSVLKRSPEVSSSGETWAVFAFPSR